LRPARAARASELSQGALQVGDLSDRAALMALNAGIEGLRVGGEGRARAHRAGRRIAQNSRQRTSTGAHEIATGLRAFADQARAAAGTLDESAWVAHVRPRKTPRARPPRRKRRGGPTRRWLSALEGFRAHDDKTEALVAQLGASAARVAGTRSPRRGRWSPASSPRRARRFYAALAQLEHAGDGAAVASSSASGAPG